MFARAGFVRVFMFLFTSRAPSEAPAASKPSVPFAEPLQRAARATGVSFDYLARTAERESRFDPKAKAGTSSATGMFQFLDQTWLGMVKQEGARLGLGSEAQAIGGEAGRFSVSDPAMRQKIMALREDPAVSAMMAGAFASRNGQQLEQSLGRKVSDGELYMAHFLGASGARELIQLARQSPDSRAASAFPDAAAANRSVFFERGGRARSAREVYDNLAATFAGPPAQAPSAANREAAHDMFRVKGDGRPMHGLFRSNGEPVASAVADAWTRMGRRQPVTQAAETRVAFFPRDASRAVMSDAAPQVTLPEAGRGKVNVPLPPARPDAQPAPQAVDARKRQARIARPLDILQFSRAGVRS
jgi:Transglycosylase SLT domain